MDDLHTGDGATDGQARHRQRLARLRRQVEALAEGQLRLGKDTSNLFRDRKQAPARRLDVRDFREVLQVDAAGAMVEVEGMTPYADLVAATLPCGFMPAVVPQLRSITIGGAVSGVGIESTSFREGLVHETVTEMEVLLADGSVVVARPDNEYADLFYGLPNSYGTLGYALRLRARLLPVQPFVELRYERFADAAACFERMAALAAGEVDFLDGVVFGRGEYILCTGRMVDAAPYASDYTFEHIYYRSIRERELDYLSIHDYIWRWDTDWFWCSKNVGAQNPLIRRLLGRKRLNSVTYTRIMRWNSRWGITRRLNRLRGVHTESVIQDVDIPIERAPEFLDFFLREIGITPAWLCPIGPRRDAGRFGLYPMTPGKLYVNFGFWDVISTRRAWPPGHFNRLVEEKVRELGGIKSLYSDSYYSEEEFWQIYDGQAYRALKSRYDPDGRLSDLYHKCVLRE